MKSVASRLTSYYTTGDFRLSYSGRRGERRFLSVGLVGSVEWCAHFCFVAEGWFAARIFSGCHVVCAGWVAGATTSLLNCISDSAPDAAGCVEPTEVADYSRKRAGDVARLSKVGEGLPHPSSLLERRKVLPLGVGVNGWRGGAFDLSPAR